MFTPPLWVAPLDPQHEELLEAGRPTERHVEEEPPRPARLDDHPLHRAVGQVVRAADTRQRRGAQQDLADRILRACGVRPHAELDRRGGRVADGHFDRGVRFGQIDAHGGAMERADQQAIGAARPVLQLRRLVADPGARRRRIAGGSGEAGENEEAKRESDHGEVDATM